MLTATEVVFLKDLIEHLGALSEASEHTSNEVDLALEMLNRIEPVDTERAIGLFDDPEELSTQEEV